MKKYVVSGMALAAGLMVGATGALAQSSTTSKTSGAHGQSATTAQSSAMTQQKLRKSLGDAGFQNITIVDAAYLVQAKTKDGETVVMMINPPMASGATTGSSSSSSTPNDNNRSGSGSGTSR